MILSGLLLYNIVYCYVKFYHIYLVQFKIKFYSIIIFWITTEIDVVQNRIGYKFHGVLTEN